MVNNLPSVGFQGEKGSYSEKAVQLYFSESNNKSYTSFSDVFYAVENNEIEFAIVPIENSIEGSVNETYDLLLNSSISVVGEINVKVNHCLITHHNVKKDDINIVYSHTQALGQCSNYLRKYNRDAVSTYDTAGSVKMIKEKDIKNAAAIASKETAILYDMQIIDENIQDHKDNITRFVCLSKKETKPTGNDKTSIIFSAGHVSGALHKALDEFAKRSINLTKIESHPTRKKAWEYNFYLDFEGHIDEKICQDAIKGLESTGSAIKVLGSYPKLKDKL